MPKRNELERALASELDQYAQSHTWKASLILLWHYGLFVACIILAILLDNLPLQLVLSGLAGVQISALFVVAHDCAHGAFFTSKMANAVFGRLAMLPTLHNFSLWRFVHNRLHHSAPNVRGLNSWSPLSPVEYRAAGPVRRFRERFYRSLAGFPFYYLIERWLSYKLVPGPSIPPELRRAALGDFALVVLFLAGWLAACGMLGASGNETSFVESAGLGFAIPFALWNFLMAQTVYLQHTSPRIPWFEDDEDIDGSVGQQDVTMHVVTPRWFGFISNDIMEHTAHHLHPKIPLYNLHAAQQHLEQLLGDRLLQVRLTPTSLLETIRVCKLYDYKAHCWYDFSGNVSAKLPRPGSTSVDSGDQVGAPG
jgi:omega-6 fatty acid desaturase (delta-12 desaturase)